MSVVQDGFGFPMLTPPVYDYIVEGDINVKISFNDIAEPGIKHIVSSVSVMSLFVVLYVCILFL